MRKLLLLAPFVCSLMIYACAEDQYGSSENPITATDCTLTQGYWKNHPGAWPVSSVQLGSVAYSKAEALQILGRSVNGNGLVSLAHQLIATKLNVASGSTNAVATQIADADAMIGALVVPPIGNGSMATATT